MPRERAVKTGEIGSIRNKPRRWSSAVMGRIAELATHQPALSARSIKRLLDGEFGEADTPRERTIRDILETLRPQAASPWMMAAATVEDAALIMPVWQDVISRTDGRAHALTEPEAKWLLYIRRICPDQPRAGELSFWRMYLLARELALLEQRGQPVTGPQSYLAYAPWRGFAEAWRYEQAVKEKRIPPLLSPSLVMPEVEVEQPHHGWTEETIREWHRLHEVPEEGSIDDGAQR